MTVEDIAHICHEANRSLCLAKGDNSQQHWESAEQWQRDSAIEGVKAFILKPDMTPKDQHEAWKAHKIKDGWVFGPIKDSQYKTHPCITDYENLPQEQRLKDELFQSICRTFINLVTVA